MSFIVEMDTRYLRAIPVEEPPLNPSLEIGPILVGGRPMVLQIATSVSSSASGAGRVVLEAQVIDSAGGRWLPIVGLTEPHRAA